MKLVETSIAGAWVIESKAFQDKRGAFSRLFCMHELQAILGSRTIAQINHSMTHSVGAVRGLHYQNAPHAEMKIVRCLKGRVFDVAADLRQGSPTFLKWTAVELTPENNLAFVIPEGCAHGFQVLEPVEMIEIKQGPYSGENDKTRFAEAPASVKRIKGATS